MKKNVFALAILLAVAAGCSGEDAPKDTELTKDDARDKGGVSEEGEDLCERFGWYGDSVCDDFCVNEDSDCDSGNNTNNGSNNGTTGVNNGSTGTNNGTTGGNNGTTGTNNGTTGSNNNTGGTNNTTGTNGTNNGTAGPVACGARAGDTCADDEYCEFTELAMCGATDQQGVCTVRPDACPDNIDPVCGCDGQTYNNECEAQAAGTDALRKGACDANVCSSDADCGRGETCVNGVCEPVNNPGACGGRTGQTCPAGEYCHYDEADMCGAFDAPGTCETPPMLCPTVYMPVCGCDGNTYSNDCVANGAGTSVMSQGECPTACQNNGDCDRGERCVSGFCESNVSLGICGGIAGLTCQPDEWCDYPDLAVCGAADQQGVCQMRPDACLAVYDPVCGCDGMTYSNGCTANMNGVDVMSDGVCP